MTALALDENNVKEAYNDESVRRNLVIRMAWCTSITCLIYAPIVGYLSSWTLLVHELALAALALVPVLLYKMGYEQTSKYLLIAVSNLCLIPTSMYFGSESNLHFGAFITLGFALIISGTRQTGPAIFGALASASTYFAIKYYCYEGQFFKDSPEDSAAQLVGRITEIATFIILLFEFLSLNQLLLRSWNREREISRSLVEQSERLATTSESRHTLLHVLCHDIAGFLSVILLQTKILMRRSENVNNFNSKELARIQNAGEKISTIVSNLRLLESVELGKRKLILEPISLVEIAKSAIDNHHAQLAKKDISVEHRFLGFENIRVKGVASLVEFHVIGNLLSNAIKFSSNSSTIEIFYTVENGRISICIKDHGIGIPQPLLENLFSKNHATTRRGTSGESGTGFGLPVVRAIARKLNGEVAIESSTENGSSGTTAIFTISFSEFDSTAPEQYQTERAQEDQAFDLAS